MTALSIYLITRLSGLACMAIFGIAGCVALTVISIITEVEGAHKDDEGIGGTLVRNRKGFIIGIFISALISVAIPTQKEIAAMYVLPKLANVEFIQEVPGELTVLASEWLKELKPNKGD